MLLVISRLHPTGLLRNGLGQASYSSFLRKFWTVRYSADQFLSFYIYGIKICKSSPDIFSSMLCLGIALNILFYFLINASYVVGIFPTTGLPIPFFSYGGSHTLFNMLAIGIIMNISKYTNAYKYKYINYG